MKREISKQREQFVPRMQRKQGTYKKDKGAKKHISKGTAETGEVKSQKDLETMLRI